MNDTPWHQLEAEQAFRKLDSCAAGISTSEAAARLDRHGPNEISMSRRISPWAILASQFHNVLIVILLLATAASAVLGHGIESIVIAIIVLFAVLLGFVQEFRAERALEALRRMAAPGANVRRDGAETRIAAREVVPGDVILLHMGDQVPADARVFENFNLQVDEAALTGESLSVAKHADALTGATETRALGDLNNMVHAGTVVTYGRARAVVVASGMQTEFGRIAGMLQSVESTQTPLQRNLDQVGNALARGALVVVAIIVALGVMRGQALVEMFIFGVALAVAVVPEALPAVVTISLAIGVQRMVKRHALVRHLPAVETLGSTSVICTDKTGTLTRDEMTVRRIYCAERMFEVSGVGYSPQGGFSCGDGTEVEAGEALREMLRCAALASDAALICEDSAEGTECRIVGDPTEGAMIVAAAKAELWKESLDSEHQRVDEIPFTAESRRMTTLHRSGEGLMACAKGAPESILDICDTQLGADGPQPLDAAARERILALAQDMAQQALRVLAVACSREAGTKAFDSGMCFLGLAGMSDPPRAEARQAIDTCIKAGIRPIMITGDHPLTAQAVARELGLMDGTRVLSGAEIDALSDPQLQEQVESIGVYARVSPAHKLRVVQAWQARGHVVAMTGDGVNDAPALKQADVGIAMGISGTDVSREAAAITLTDDNFASIVAAVEEGRAVFGNIKKYLMYLLSSNIGEIGLMGGAALLGLPLPLAAVQILYVNLATDGLPALALAVDPPEPDLMQNRPRDVKEGIFTRPVITLMVVGGIWSTLVNLGLFIWALHSGRALEEAMTMAFVSLVLIQFFKAYNFRSDRRSVLHKPFANKWLNRAIVWELALLLLIINVPVLHHAFRAESLPLADWIIITTVAATVMAPLEITKALVRRGWFRSHKSRN